MRYAKGSLSLNRKEDKFVLEFGTGNVMAVMDAMGHQSVNTTRIYNHSNVTLIREAIERRNQQLSETVQ